MLLQKLVDLSERMEELAPPMYTRTPVKWLIPINENGKLLGGLIQTTGEKPRGKQILVPHVQRTAGVKAKLLADNAEYVLGIPRDPAKSERVARCHAAFVEEVERCAEATEEPAVQAVRHFLSTFDLETLALPEEFEPGDVMTFRVGTVLPVALPSVRRHWARTQGASDSKSAMEMECLVCGEVKPVEASLPFKFKGIPGGQSSGMALVSANKKAFESYGLERAHISPICRECGEAFTKAAEQLTRRDGSHLRVGSALYLFWTREDRPVMFGQRLSDPKPEDVKALLTAARRGRPEALDIDTEPFYAVSLTASGGRVVVRDWITTTVAEAERNQARFFRLQRITDPEHPEPRPLKLVALAGATVRDLKDLHERVQGALVRMALVAGPLPDNLLYEAVRRNRAEQRVTRPRAALIKMVLLSQRPPEEEEDMVDLDKGNHEPAYLCGRLLAVLEEVQKAAIPGAKATLVDRFFGSASAAPASVFGTLLRNAQPHLAKLRKEKRKVYEALERRLEEVMLHLPPDLPRTLDLRQQGMFSLGYYHQRARTRAAIVAAVEAKKAGASSEATNH